MAVVQGAGQYFCYSIGYTTLLNVSDTSGRDFSMSAPIYASFNIGYIQNLERLLTHCFAWGIVSIIENSCDVSIHFHPYFSTSTELVINIELSEWYWMIWVNCPVPNPNDTQLNENRVHNSPNSLWLDIPVDSNTLQNFHLYSHSLYKRKLK